jgi:hypothetical protein
MPLHSVKRRSGMFVASVYRAIASSWSALRELVAVIVGLRWREASSDRGRPKGWTAMTAVFWAATLAHLFLVWALPYVPTQDGPSHLGNALMMKGLGDPQTRYGEYFTLRPEPVPNWTCHVLLVALLYIFPPLAAEKVVVSLYVVGLAGAYRYFLGSFGPRTMVGGASVLLFMFNKCFFMGFYNYCLSLLVIFFVFGYVLRRGGPFGLRQWSVLALAFLVAYFTHLVGFVIAVIGATWLVATRGPARGRALFGLAVAVLPAMLLMVDYLATTRFFVSGGGTSLLRQSLGQQLTWARLSGELDALHDALWAVYDGGKVSLDWMVMGLFEALLLAAVCMRPTNDSRHLALWPIAGLAMAMLLFHFLLPEGLGQHGGFLRDRFAPLAPLLAIACFRRVWHGWTSLVLQAALYALVGWNALLLTGFFREANEVIQTFSSGVACVGEDRTLIVYRPEKPSDGVDYLLHAGYYYCLNTRNIDLDNYEADTLYFPLRYRAADQRWRGSVTDYVSRNPVDIIIMWKAELTPTWPTHELYREIYQHGNLTIYERQSTGKKPTPNGR